MNTTTAAKAFHSPRTPAAGDALGGGLADPLSKGESPMQRAPAVAKAPASAPVQAMGEVDAALPSSSGGSPLPSGLRGDMESSYGADFSNVKVHTDGAGGAKAFARGEHVHFGSGQFDPHSKGGREVIGHELGHVQQQRADRVPVPQFSDFPVNDDPALEGEADREGAKAARGEKAQIAGNTRGLASEKGAAQGWDWPWAKKKAAQPAGQQQAQPPAPDAAPPEQAPPSASGQQVAPPAPNTGGRQIASDNALIGDAASKGAIVGSGVGLMAANPAAAKFGGSNAIGAPSSAIGGTVLGAGGMIAAAMSLKGGSDRRDAAKKSGDKAGEQIGNDTVSEGKQGLGMAAVSTANAAVDITNISKNGASAVMSNAKTAADLTAAGGNALAIAGASLGIAGNALAFMQAAYHGGQAIARWSALTSAKEKIESERGKVWYERVKNRTKTKTALQGLKMAAAGIGIAAGALLLVSNPVGWALGLAAAATMGAMALGKLAGGWWKKRQQNQAAKQIEKDKKGASASGPAPEQAAKQQVQSQQVEVAQDLGGEQQAAPPAPEEEAKPKGGPSERKHVQSLADEAAAACSTNAKIAGEMVGAVHVYRSYTPDDIMAQIKASKGLFPPLDEFCDSIILLKILGISEEQAASNSGQELVENKISAVAGL